MIQKYIFTTLLIAFGVIAVQGQVNSDTGLIKFKYFCYSDSNSIFLPADFQGPKYYNYEEGSIVDFVAPDLSIVSILCGANAVLNCNETYSETDTIKNKNGGYSIYYIDKSHDVYSRKLRAENRIYMYCNASNKRKIQLDYVFDLIEKTK